MSSDKYYLLDDIFVVYITVKFHFICSGTDFVLGWQENGSKKRFSFASFGERFCLRGSQTSTWEGRAKEEKEARWASFDGLEASVFKGSEVQT